MTNHSFAIDRGADGEYIIPTNDSIDKWII